MLYPQGAAQHGCFKTYRDADRIHSTLCCQLLHRFNHSSRCVLCQQGLATIGYPQSNALLPVCCPANTSLGGWTAPSIAIL